MLFFLNEQFRGVNLVFLKFAGLDYSFRSFDFGLIFFCEILLDIDQLIITLIVLLIMVIGSLNLFLWFLYFGLFFVLGLLFKVFQLHSFNLINYYTLTLFINSHLKLEII